MRTWNPRHGGGPLALPLGWAVAAALTLTAVVLAVPPADSRAQWLAAENLSAAQSRVGCGWFCTRPGSAAARVGIDGDGQVLVTWLRREGEAVRMQARRRPPGTAFRPVRDLGEATTYTGTAAPWADLAVDLDGSAAAAWSGAGTLVASRQPGGGWGAPVAVGASSAAPRIALGGGRVTTLSQVYVDFDDEELRALTREPGQSAFGAPESLVGGRMFSPDVVMNAAGATVVIWARRDGEAKARVEARVRPAGAAAFGPLLVLSPPGENAYYPSAALAPDGRTTVVWEREDGPRSRVQARAIAADGVTLTNVDTLSGADRDAYRPQVAVDGADTAIAAWRACPTASTCRIESSSRPSGGGFASPPHTVSAPGAAAGPVLAADGGSATIAWLQGDQPHALQAARRPIAGTPGAVRTLSASGAGAYEPHVAMDGEGNAVVAWSEARPEGELTRVAAYDAGPPRFGNVSVPSHAVTGEAVAMAASAIDRWSGASLSWSFGDGTGGAGEQLAHAFGSAGVYGVAVTAADGVGNATSTVRTVQVRDVAPPPAAPGPPTPPTSPRATPSPRAITAPVSARWRVRGSRTTIARLRLSRLPAGARVVVRCSGRGCPFRSKRAAPPRRGVVNALAVFGKRRTLGAGRRIEIRVTAGRRIGKVVRYRLRRGRPPAVTALCLPLGSSRPEPAC